MLFIRTKHNLQIFGGIPFIKLQNDTYTAVKCFKNKTKKNDENWDGKLNHFSVLGWAVLLSWLYYQLPISA